MSERGEIFVPDRFEALQREAGGELQNVIEPLSQPLSEIDRIVARMKAARRGAFLLLRGDSGSGKSTFLHTIGIFKQGIDTVSVPSAVSIRSWLEGNSRDTGVRVFVLEEREALLEFSNEELETWLHEINGFLRSQKGQNAIWTCTGIVPLL